MILILLTSFLVFARGIQQQNVIGGYYIPAIFNSYLIAFCEVLMVLSVVETGWESIGYVGTGGAIGVVASMFTFRWIRKRFSKGNHEGDMRKNHE